MNKLSQLQALETEIVASGICPELAKSATQLVFGVGNPDSAIMFIGEAPGKNEDIQGQPFVGAAGKFLDELLRSIDLRREKVYITNIVKYRPPDNRDPLPEEKEAFLPYLFRQIEIIDPLLVIPLGRHSLGAFISDRTISEIHGQPKRTKGRVILPLFHPAAALYNGSMRQVLVDDFQKIPQVLKLIKDPKQNNSLATTKGAK